MVQLNPLKWGAKKRKAQKKQDLLVKTATTKVTGRQANKRRSDANITLTAQKRKKEREERAKARANRPKTGQGGRALGSTTKRAGTTATTSKATSKSKGSKVLINGKPPSRIQQSLLKGGWSVKELEAKINARKKKK